MRVSLLSSAGGEPLIGKGEKRKKCLVQKKKCLMLVFAFVSWRGASHSQGKKNAWCKKKNAWCKKKNA
jgi:hypothetical protein